MASRVALDGQGRLILRENGKIILPYEHFANAVMLKHMNGPHGLHLGLEGTIRAVSCCFINRYYQLFFETSIFQYTWNHLMKQ
jgi:hypothetical protein